MTIREALLAMAYREIYPGTWGKPVGSHLFMFLEEKMEWSNWFKDASGIPSVFEHQIFNAGADFLRAIKTVETYTRININPTGLGDFQLSAIDLG